MSRLRSDLLAGHASSENQSGVVPAQPLILNIRVSRREISPSYPSERGESNGPEISSATTTSTLMGADSSSVVSLLFQRDPAGRPNS